MWVEPGKQMRESDHSDENAFPLSLTTTYNPLFWMQIKKIWPSKIKRLRETSSWIREWDERVGDIVHAFIHAVFLGTEETG